MTECGVAAQVTGVGYGFFHTDIITQSVRLSTGFGVRPHLFWPLNPDQNLTHPEVCGVNSVIITHSERKIKPRFRFQFHHIQPVEA